MKRTLTILTLVLAFLGALFVGAALEDAFNGGTATAQAATEKARPDAAPTDELRAYWDFIPHPAFVNEWLTWIKIEQTQNPSPRHYLYLTTGTDERTGREGFFVFYTLVGGHPRAGSTQGD
jgi:hypothetical protein